MLGNGSKSIITESWNGIFVPFFPKKNFIIFSSAFFPQSGEYVIMYLVLEYSTSYTLTDFKFIL